LLFFLLDKTVIFGTTLQFLADRDHRMVPLIVEQSIKEVERRGLNEEGIYRISGAATAIQELKHQYDSCMIINFNFFFFSLYLIFKS